MRTLLSIQNSAFRLLLHPVMIVIAAGLYFILIRYLDTRWRFLPYVFAVTACIAAIAYLLSKRPVFSLYAGGLSVLLIAAASVVKYRLKGLGLHVYDFAFTGSDSSAVKFLVTHYQSIFVMGLAFLLLAALFLTLLYRAEKPLRLPLWVRAGGVAAGLVLPVVFYPSDRIEEPDYLPFVAGYNASAFLLSIGHVEVPLGQIKLSDRTDRVDTPERFVDTAECGQGKRPDIFLVLAETQTDPAIFPQLKSTGAISNSMRSSDGRSRPLYVEVFGGGTWVTNFSVLTGLSSADFGWQSSYISALMEGKIRGALPEVLARCGYRTVTVMPMMYNFVNEGPFLKSIGIQEVYDAEAMGAEQLLMRDKLYFDFAEKLIKEHREKDNRPLFLAIQTMFTHSPYHKSEAWDSLLPETKFSDHEKANEYMRRLTLARSDLQSFVSLRKEEPGARGSLVVEFGDHQGEATRDFVFELAGGSAALADFRSLAYRTYFSVHDFGAGVDFSKIREGEDVPYLTARILDAANLPTSPMYRDLVRLADICDGRFHTCKDRRAVDHHLRKRENGGMLSLGRKVVPEPLLAAGE